MPFEIGKVTKDDIRKASATELMAAYRSPELREEIERVANTPELTSEQIAEAEQIAQQAAQQAVEAEAEANRVAAEQAAQAEAARIAAEQPVVPEVKPEEKKKIVVDYQVTDEQGAPIGRPTHIEAWTIEELIEKQKKAHIEATRYAHRLKTRKDQATYKPTEPVRLTDAQIAAAAAELQSDDKTVQEAARKRIEDDAKLVAQKQNVDQDAKDRQALHEERVSLAWMQGHITDFFPCRANAQILVDYLRINNLEYTIENLELAFLESESQLAPRPELAVNQPAPVVNPPVVQAPTVAPAAPVAAPVAAQPTIPAVVAPPRAPGGIEPGVTLTGRQPVAQAPKLTKADVRKWTPAEMRKQLKDTKVLAEFNFLFPQK